MSLNVVTLSGRLVRDPAVKSNADRKWATFTVAVNEWTPNGEQASFIDCIAWGRQAEIVGEYTKKGDFIQLVGRLRTSSYKASDGTNRKKTEVNVNGVHLMPRGASSQTQDGEKKAEKEEEVDFNDIPF